MRSQPQIHCHFAKIPPCAARPFLVIYVYKYESTESHERSNPLVNFTDEPENKYV